MMLYRIKNAAKLFETAESRKYVTLRWVCVPNKHDGAGFRRIMRLKDAGNVYSAWHLMLQVASKCSPRWLLADENGTPLTSEDLADKTGYPAQHFERALKVLSDKAIGWIEPVQSELINSDAEGINSNLNLDRVRNVTERNETDVTQQDQSRLVVEAWNQLGTPFPRVAALTDKRLRRLRERLADGFFTENWRAALTKVKRSKFCRGECGDRGWRANFDWFLRPDSVAKTMEGQYDDRKTGGFNIDRDGTDPEVAAILEDMRLHPDNPDEPFDAIPAGGEVS
jgi:hypothetical protein